MIKKPKLVFFGTPDFAVASLNAIMKSGFFDIVGVVTGTDKMIGRGKQPTQTAVKQFAIANNLNIIETDKMRDPIFIEKLRLLNADIQVVVAFKMMPELVWNMPPMGTINLHGSLLPQYRGAAPVNRVIMNGETETGVTTFKLKHQIDTGNILLQEKVQILPEDNFGTLYEKLMIIGADLLVKTLDNILSGNFTEVEQDNIDVSLLKPSPKIFKEDCIIDWDKNGADIINQIRGLAPYPSAFTILNDKVLKVFSARAVQETVTTTLAYETDKKTFFSFKCNDGWVYLDYVQLEGKKAMDIKSFLAGYKNI